METQQQRQDDKQTKDVSNVSGSAVGEDKGNDENYRAGILAKLQRYRKMAAESPWLPPERETRKERRERKKKMQQQAQHQLLQQQQQQQLLDENNKAAPSARTVLLPNTAVADAAPAPSRIGVPKHILTIAPKIQQQQQQHGDVNTKIPPRAVLLPNTVVAAAAVSKSEVQKQQHTPTVVAAHPEATTTTRIHHPSSATLDTSSTSRGGGGGGENQTFTERHEKVQKQPQSVSKVVEHQDSRGIEKIGFYNKNNTDPQQHNNISSKNNQNNDNINAQDENSNSEQSANEPEIIIIDDDDDGNQEEEQARRKTADSIQQKNFAQRILNQYSKALSTNYSQPPVDNRTTVASPNKQNLNKSDGSETLGDESHKQSAVEQPQNVMHQRSSGSAAGSSSSTPPPTSFVNTAVSVEESMRAKLDYYRRLAARSAVGQASRSPGGGNQSSQLSQQQQHQQQLQQKIQQENIGSPVTVKDSSRKQPVSDARLKLEMYRKLAAKSASRVPDPPNANPHQHQQEKQQQQYQPWDGAENMAKRRKKNANNSNNPR